MELDHFVMHIDNDETILSRLKEKVEPLGYPFEPKNGKGTNGFKAANIWIGRQYFEIIRILNSEGGGWTKHWVERYNEGARGLDCIFLAVNSIDDVAKKLKNQGIKTQGPERITFKSFFGLLKKTLPWQLIYLPPIPGTNIKTGFIEYDHDPHDYVRQYLVPNSDQNGIMGVESADVFIPLSSEALLFLEKIFPNGIIENDFFNVAFNPGSLSFKMSTSECKIELFAESRASNFKGGSFQLLDVTVTTI